MVAQLPYCGTPPTPATLLLRFNLDPVLIGVLVLAAARETPPARRRYR